MPGSNNHARGICCGMQELFALLFLMLLLQTQGKVYADKQKEESHNKQNQNFQLTPKDIYKAGFQMKRAEQLTAVKRMLSLPSYEKQYSIVEIVLKKLFLMLTEAKLRTMQIGYIPGGDFPDKREDQETLGLVFENTAFFGDILLRMPKITHEVLIEITIVFEEKFYEFTGDTAWPYLRSVIIKRLLEKLLKSQSEWRLIIKWSISFCNESGIFAGANEKLLNLVAQELKLVPRDPNYVNPYKDDSMKGVKEPKIPKDSKKKNQKKKRKGPRLSRTDL